MSGYRIKYSFPDFLFDFGDNQLEDMHWLVRILLGEDIVPLVEVAVDKMVDYLVEVVHKDKDSFFIFLFYNLIIMNF